MKTILKIWHDRIGYGTDPTPPDLLQHSPKIFSTALPTNNWNELSEKEKFEVREKHYEEIKLKLR